MSASKVKNKEHTLPACENSGTQDACRPCTVQMVRLGDYIERSMANNSKLLYGEEYIEGVNSNGEFCKTKANLVDINLKPYKLVYDGDFVYNPSRFNIGSIAYRTQGFCIVSHLYVVFHLTEKGKQLIDPQYLYLYIYRSEFFRMVTYLNFGSQRPEFNFFELSEVHIPLPSIEVQRELVGVYEGLKRLAEENEAMLAPLAHACEAFIINCKKNYPTQALGEYIEECDERNSNGEITLSQGISNLKYFQDPKQVAENSKSDKIVRKGQFAYNRATTRNGEKISIAYREGADCTVSSAYGVFYITDESKLLPQYLMLFFKRAEFDRYARWRSEGSAHEFFTFDMMCAVQIPIPPIGVQEKIVALYRCYEECKRIATEAREQLKTICPALVQRGRKQTF